MFPWKGKKVLVFGLGVLGGGVGVAKFFAENGAKVTVTDLKTAQELKSSLEELKNFQIRYVLGRHEERDFRNHDLIVKNPAVSHNSPYLKIALRAKIPVEMEASLFSQLTVSKNIIGITGTKGKTTTTLLIGKILKEAKYKTLIAGVPRRSLLGSLAKITPITWVVLELSSWQLEGLLPQKFSPQIAVLTNIFPDHLNRYQTFQDYVAAKKIIFQFQKKNDFFITSKELAITKKLANLAKSQVLFFKKDILPEEIKREINLPGQHNLLNVAAAFTVAKLFGIENSVIIYVLKKFRNLNGHLQVIKKLNGVTFINDTTATIPEATIAGILTLTQPIILLVGGADKSLNFSKLGQIINQKVKAVVLLAGTATDKIEKEIEKDKVLGRFSNFENAVFRAFKFAKKGDVVFLSPATASFGMFKNEYDRGEQFNSIVNQLTS